jgi:EpsI family protein
MRKLRAYAPALILLVGCGFILQTHTQRAVPLAGSLTTVLPALPGYTVHDQHISDDERRVAGMTEYVARVYARDTLIAFTTLVSYYDRQSQGKTIHSPRNCLPGAGWEVLNAGTRSIQADGAQHVVNHYTLKNGAATAVVYYWYQGRGRVVASEYAVKWNLLRDAAVLGHTEEALVRVVSYVNPPAGGQRDSAAFEHAFADADATGAQVAARLIDDVTRVLPGARPTPAAARSRTRTAFLVRSPS